MSDVRSPEITPDMAAHVLFHFGEGGWEPGNFVRQLVQLIAVADLPNKQALGLGFPGYVAAVNLAQNTAGGTAMLGQIALSVTTVRAERADQTDRTEITS